MKLNGELSASVFHGTTRRTQVPGITSERQFWSLRVSVDADCTTRLINSGTGEVVREWVGDAQEDNVEVLEGWEFEFVPPEWSGAEGEEPPTASFWIELSQEE